MEQDDERQGFLICRECGKKFGMITSQHLKLHGMTTEQYKAKYPGQDLWGKGFRSSFKYSDSTLFKNIENIDKIPKVEEIKIPKDLKDIRKDETLDTSKVLSRKGGTSEPSYNGVHISDDKFRIFQAIKDFFPCVETNYFIEKMDSARRLEYRVVTDFCDPGGKIIIDFPNSFWHNYDISSENLKRTILPGEGWKVIEILSRNPSPSDVEEELSKIKDPEELDLPTP